MGCKFTHIIYILNLAHTSACRQWVPGLCFETSMSYSSLSVPQSWNPIHYKIYVKLWKVRLISYRLQKTDFSVFSKQDINEHIRVENLHLLRAITSRFSWLSLERNKTSRFKMSFLLMSDAVSYTHLDVYKRQLLYYVFSTCWMSTIYTAFTVWKNIISKDSTYFSLYRVGYIY